MIRFIGKRLLMMIPVVFGVILVVFTMMYITPGDPARSMLGEAAAEEEVENLREELGLNDPYLVRLGRYIKDMILHGDLGTSYTTKQPVTTEIMTRFPTTFYWHLSVCWWQSALASPREFYRQPNSTVFWIISAGW